MPMTIPFVQLYTYIYYGVKDVLPNVLICLARSETNISSAVPSTQHIYSCKKKIEKGELCFIHFQTQCIN